jgi:hypothetical protein
MEKNVLRAILGLALVCCVSQVALANSGTQIPLDQIIPGTESTTPVPNGGFENPASSGAPDSWTNYAGPEGFNTLSGQMFRAAPINPGSAAGVLGSFAAQGPANGTDNQYRQNLSLLPNTAYVVSAYVWNFGAASDLVTVEVVDAGNTLNVAGFSIEPTALDGGSAANGYFVSQTFNSSQFPDLNVYLKAMLDWDSNSASERPSAILGQIDNVSVTLASEYAAPQLIPEPASLSLLALSVLALRRRR